jgi:hypothetical protein
MTRAEKIQAAIDALPNATGGEWAISHSPNYGGEHFFEGPDGEEYEVGPALLGGSTEDSVARAADATLISAARELAEEVVRLRKVVGNLWKVIPAGTAEALRNPTHPYADVWAQQYSLELPLPNPEPE